MDIVVNKIYFSKDTFSSDTWYIVKLIGILNSLEVLKLRILKDSVFSDSSYF